MSVPYCGAVRPAIDIAQMTTNSSMSPSHVRMKMSESKSQRSAGGKERHTPRMFVGAPAMRSMRTLLTTTSSEVRTESIFSARAARNSSI